MGVSTKSYIVIRKEVENVDVLKEIHKSLNRQVQESYEEALSSLSLEKQNPFIRLGCLPSDFSFSAPAFNSGRFGFGYFVDNDKYPAQKKFKFETDMMAEDRSLFVFLDSIGDVNKVMADVNENLMVDESMFKVISIDLGYGGCSEKVVKQISKDVCENIGCVCLYFPNNSMEENYELISRSQQQKNKLKP